MIFATISVTISGPFQRLDGKLISTMLLHQASMMVTLT